MVLIGLRASGKSTLGRAVAERASRPFVDLDEPLARRAGTATAGDALRSLGEPAFRAIESQLVAEFFGAPRREPAAPAVFALGGGTPTAPGAKTLLHQARDSGRACIVLLDAPIDVLTGRMAEGRSDRPPLTNLPPREEMERVARDRMEAYRQLAEATIDTGAMTPGAAADALLQIWENHSRRGA